MITDKFGLVQENQFLVAYIPAKNSALVWRVKSRFNTGREIINYGPLPLKAGDKVSTYEGGSATVPADGVMPARSYTAEGKSFPMEKAVDKDDMWYLTEEYSDRVFHVIQQVTPAFLRIDVHIPIGVLQGRFQRDKIAVGVGEDFGFARGTLETIHLHEVHYGYRWGNDTNLPVYTFVRFVYGEYLVEVPRDADLIFSILTKKIPSHWITLPINVWDTTIENGMLRAYGFLGFPVYGMHEKDKAVAEYRTLLREVK